ncbi:hypothetical protein AJ80_06650 [Polytolypa hystricis UAMH7299]|uniref:Uncharacterized protein n=1 Tax=Polytolypa hystricis (strain UAMH7299) TaxID=1447883 RepID=A0A2B7XVD6_POLH7|nr:hypothetical protein AJ80_06650 [Polytolypa hystricis UAMH7299]
MADPLSFTASIAAVTVPALHGMRLLLNDLRRIRDAPETVEDLKDDIRSADTALTLLQAVQNSDWESLSTRHSEGGRLSRRDRATVGFFKHDQIESISKQLQNCKITVNSMVSIATLYSSIRHTHVTEEIKKTISTRQIEIRTAIDATDERLAEAETRLEELHIDDDTIQEDAEGTGSRADVLGQIEEERTALSASRKLLDELLAKVQEDVVVKAAKENQTRSIHVSFSGQNSGLQIGTSNAPINGIRFGA